MAHNFGPQCPNPQADNDDDHPQTSDLSTLRAENAQALAEMRVHGVELHMMSAFSRALDVQALPEDDTWRRWYAEYMAARDA